MKKNPLVQTVAFPRTRKLWTLFDKVLLPSKSNEFKTAETSKLENGLVISEYCSVRGRRGDFYSLRVTPGKKLLAYLSKTMLLIDNDQINFEIVIREGGKALVLAKYNQIIGSRWLALVPATEVPKNLNK
jgi:hypothetical protein